MKLDWSYEGLLAAIEAAREEDEKTNHAAILFETRAFIVNRQIQNPRIYLAYRDRVFAFVFANDDVMLDITRREKVSHELQRRINDLLRSRGWVLVCPDVTKPWLLINKHNNDTVQIDAASVGKHECRNYGYANVPEVPRKEEPK